MTFAISRPATLAALLAIGILGSNCSDSRPQRVSPHASDRTPSEEMAATGVEATAIKTAASDESIPTEVASNADITVSDVTSIAATLPRVVATTPSETIAPETTNPQVEEATNVPTSAQPENAGATTRALPVLTAEQFTDLENRVLETVFVCQSCHVYGGVRPDFSSKTRDALKDNAEVAIYKLENKLMPPPNRGRTISDVERAELIQYLNYVKAPTTPAVETPVATSEHAAPELSTEEFKLLEDSALKAMTVCKTCHVYGDGVKPFFAMNTKRLLRENAEIALVKLENNLMPPPNSGEQLADADRAVLIRYLNIINAKRDLN